MTTLRSGDWLPVIRDEYLTSYVARGGSSVKFAVPLGGGEPAAIRAEVERLARDSGHLFVSVDAASTKVHMIDHVFYALAEQVPWRQTVRTVIGRRVTSLGLAMPPDTTDGPLFEAIAAVNELDPDYVQLELRRKVVQQVFRDYRLAKDFRVAMTHLILAELSGGHEADTVFDTLRDWLTGANRAVSAVKPYQIYRRIDRASARFFLESTVSWITLAGYAGTTIVMDISRLGLARNPRDDRIFYSRAAAIDAYEVLRQFIDTIDRLSNCMIVVLAGREFLDDDPGSRGLGGYAALKFRIFDEVRDRRIVNPFASLVRLDAGEGAGALSGAGVAGAVDG